MQKGSFEVPRDACRSIWPPGWLTLRRCGCSTAASSPSRAGNRRGWPGSIVGDWARWQTARPECFWPTSAPRAGRWWINGCICPRVGLRIRGRCAAAGAPKERGSYRSKTELALEMLERARELGHLRAKRVAGDDTFGMSPSFREGLAAQGMWYVLDVPGGTTVWPLEPSWTNPEYQGFGRPRKPKLRDGQSRTMEQRSDELPEEAWREITVAEGSQGPRTYRFSAQRVRVTKRRKPGEVVWAIWRCNLDGSEPRYYLSNAPEGTPLETLAYVGGSRWRIETEFETEEGDVGLDEYETRSWAGWHHHIAMCLLGGAFLLDLQQGMGERCPGSPDPKCTGWCGRCCHGNSSGRMSCCGGWRRRFPLDHLLECSQCGVPMRLEDGPDPVYTCPGSPDQTEPCQAPALRAEDLNRHLLGQVMSAINHRQHIPWFQGRGRRSPGRGRPGPPGGG